ncbi:hypothetical protein [Mariniflexile sp.]
MQKASATTETENAQSAREIRQNANSDIMNLKEPESIFGNEEADAFYAKIIS